jgi:hypothetical protein
MSIADFVANPLSYTKGHYVQFYGANGSAAAGGTGPAAAGLQLLNTYNNWAGAWQAKQFGPAAGLFTSFRFVESMEKSDSSWGHRVGKKALHSVTCFPVTADQGIRFLPWEADHVTFMEIDANARTFFTGPLQGCMIILGFCAATGNWWAFHANRNNAGGPNNNAMKTAMTMDTVQLIGATVSIRHAARYGSEYTDQGFVFGQRSGNSWKFYAANLAIAAGGGFQMTVKQLT